MDATFTREMMSKPKILVVDDEPDLLELLEANFKTSGFDVICASTGSEALEKARQLRPALIILDLMLPELNGLEVCKSLRRESLTSRIPILILTARATEVDRVLGLELGADDYVTKPFSVRELVLRSRNLLQRNTEAEPQRDRVDFRDLAIDRARYRVTFKGKPLDLTLTEFKLVTVLAERKGRVQSREQLLKDVWGYSTLIDTRTVDTHMRRLRRKLGHAASYLDTVRGVGYRFLES